MSSLSIPDSPIRMSQNRPTVSRSPSQTQSPSQPLPHPHHDIQSHIDLLCRKSHVVLNSDGACRGNGSKNCTSSIGVYVADLSSPFCTSTLTTDLTNNQSELSSATCAVQTAIHISRLHDSLRIFTIEMDSSYVIAGCLSGRATRNAAFSKRQTSANESHWNKLHVAIDEAIRIGLSLTWTWVPRHRNRCADVPMSSVTLL